ncbi:SLAP domain-containing protein [Aquisalibacillus elongatus]|uniref:SLAP domain-containing protein n=1 Tax=Aquisalibacillus elongatus TaxID=485577 RepID=A0A3N5BLR2_9BACI|nr:SLAP domain-containing protein [Aquisalibacillus elongatus]RPF50628.1 SLAP domain-containing protein [Aquisalibacillus elongatus]
MKLVYEEKWDQNLSREDRRKIEEVFDETKESDQAIEAVTLWHAFNHKNELLVTALIHNRSENDIIFDHTHITYRTLDETIAEDTFTIPRLVVQPNTSMPWTFIFSKSEVNEPSFGTLVW